MINNKGLLEFQMWLLLWRRGTFPQASQAHGHFFQLHVRFLPDLLSIHHPSSQVVVFLQVSSSYRMVASLYPYEVK